ncbi:MAG: response regulator [Chloroflexi bacterium]|nr:response regulator [Chloroflexota bacterium]
MHYNKEVRGLLHPLAIASNEVSRCAVHQVLYIEDNYENRMLVRRILLASDEPFHVVEAESARIGIELAQQATPDIILMDLSMPEMDGLTATRTLRNIPHLHAIPIVALTANVMHGDRERSLAAGCDGYIAKPIDIDKFPDEVLFYIRSGHDRRAKQHQPTDAD